MTALSDQLAIRATELLNDGEWHSYEQTVRALVKLVPPGIALRKGTRLGERNRGCPRVGPPRTNAELTAAGARSLVIDFLRNKYFEVDKLATSSNGLGRNDGRHVRMIKTPSVYRDKAGADPMVGILDRVRKERDELELQIETLRDQVTNLRVALIGAGLQTRADEIAPPQS